MDTALLQAALSGGGVVQLEPRTYLIDASLIASVPVTVFGQRGTRIEAAVPVDCLVAISAQVRFEDVVFSGNAEPYGAPRYTRDGLVLATAAGSTFKRVRVENCLRDGVHCEVGNNDEMYVEQCSFGGCGTYYGSAIPQTPPHQLAPAPAATGDGTTRMLCTPPRWTRVGCPVRVGAAKGVVLEVQPDALVLTISVPAGPVSAWAIGVGCGWWEARSGDNGISVFSLCRFRSNSEAGLALDGLYGPTVIGGHFDSNACYGVRVGVYGSNPVIAPTFIHPYFEASGMASFLLGGTQSLSVVSALFDVQHFDYVASGVSVTGVELGAANGPLGGATSTFPASAVGDYWNGYMLEGPEKVNIRWGVISNGVLSAPGAVCMLQGGTVDSVFNPGSPGQRVTYIGGSTPTYFNRGTLLVLKDAVRVVGQYESLSLIHTGSGRWVEV